MELELPLIGLFYWHRSKIRGRRSAIGTGPLSLAGTDHPPVFTEDGQSSECPGYLCPASTLQNSAAVPPRTPTPPSCTLVVGRRVADLSSPLAVCPSFNLPASPSYSFSLLPLSSSNHNRSILAIDLSPLHPLNQTTTTHTHTLHNV